MTDESASKPITTPAFLRKLAWLAVSGPAAVGIIGRFDESFQLSRVLKSVVLQYQTVTRAFWDLIVRPLPFDVPLNRDVLTLATLIALPIAFRKYVLHRGDRHDAYASAKVFNTVVTSALAAVIVILLALLFVGRDYQLLVDLFDSWVYKLLLVIAVLIYAIPVGVPQLRGFRVQYASAGLLLLLLYPVLVTPEYAQQHGYMWVFFNGAIFLALFTFVGLNIRVAPELPINIVVVATGVFFVDWFARVVAPVLLHWVEQQASGV